MKKTIILLSFILPLIMSGCTDFLVEKNESNLSVDFIYDTPEGFQYTVNALYPMARQMHRMGENGGSGTLTTIGLFSGDDITFVRAGDGDWAGLGWYDAVKLTPSNKDVEGFWIQNYRIVGKANEILYYGEKLGKDNPIVKQVMGEAYCFRAKAYFDLYRRFDNILLNDIIYTPDNVDDTTHVYLPATQKEIVERIKSDLDSAIVRLDWKTNDAGRFTQGVARHIKLMVDMWPVDGDPAKMDLDDAIRQVEKINTDGPYSLLPNPGDVFTPKSPVALVSAKLNSDETILVEQWSNGIGGASVGSTGDLAGHRLASTFLTRYDQLSGVTQELSQGGTSWGRIYPNDYLLGLYDQTKDKRYTQFFNHFWRFNNIATTLNRKLVVTQDILDLYNSGYPLGFDIPAGTTVGTTLNFTFKNGDIIPRVMSSNYAMYLHPSTIKFFDQWTRDKLTNPSYKDIIIYRLAETYLLGAEAYLRKGNMAKALELYNKTWVRAGNTARTAITLQDILDEDARELCFESFGHRWYTLKRFGKDIMDKQITTYSGEQNILNKFSYDSSNGQTMFNSGTKENPVYVTYPSANLTNYNNYFSVRKNFTGQATDKDGKKVTVFMRWPIPYSQILSMGGNYPQNPGY